MVQNHMLQLLALVAMEPPSEFDATAVRDEKVKVLRALRPIRRGRRSDSVTGQYARGAVDGQTVPGYAEELGREAAPRRSSRSRRMSTIGGGRACPSTCAPASACPARDTEIFIQFKRRAAFDVRRRGARPSPTG